MKPMHFGEMNPRYKIVLHEDKLCVKLTDKFDRTYGPFPIRPTDKMNIYEFKFGGTIHTCYFFI